RGSTGNAKEASGLASIRGRWRSPVAVCLVAIVGVFAFAAIDQSSFVVAAAATVAILGTTGYLVSDAARHSALPVEGAERASGDPVAGVATQILQSIQEPVLLLDNTLRVLFANQATQDVIRHDPMGKPLVSVLRTPVLLHAVQSVQDTGEPQKVAFTVPVPIEQHFE